MLCGSVASSAVIVAPTAPAKPIDRSISPSRSTKTSAMPSSTNTPDCSIRFVRLPVERNLEFWVWKMTTMTISPMTTGSAPLSPLRDPLGEGADVLPERVGDQLVAAEHDAVVRD